jgi:hypothetical protein
VTGLAGGAGAVLGCAFWILCVRFLLCAVDYRTVRLRLVLAAEVPAWQTQKLRFSLLSCSARQALKRSATSTKAATRSATWDCAGCRLRRNPRCGRVLASVGLLPCFASVRASISACCFVCRVPLPCSALCARLVALARFASADRPPSIHDVFSSAVRRRLLLHCSRSCSRPGAPSGHSRLPPERDQLCRALLHR